MGHEFLGGREVVRSECDLIIEENRLLKRCLRLLRDNSALEIATILSAVIAFCDGKFRQKFAAEFSNVLEESAARREEGAPGQGAAGTIPTKYARPPSGLPPPRSFAEEMYYGFPEQWDLPERDKWTQTTFPPPLFWPRFRKQIRYDTSGHTAHIRSHLNTQTPLNADLEYDPYFLKSLVLASYYRALAKKRRGQDFDYSIYYPIFRRLSVPSVMQRMFRFPHGILFGQKLGKKWRLRPLRTSRRSSRGRSKSRRRRNRSPYEDDVEITARVGRRKPNQEKRGVQAADAGQNLGGEFASYRQGGQSDFQGQMSNVLNRAQQNMQILTGQSVPDQDVSVTVTHEHTDTTYYNDGTSSLVHDEQSRSHVLQAPEEVREQAAAEGAAPPDAEEATSTSNNNPQDFSSSSCGRPESRLTQQRCTPIDPLFKLGRRSRAGFYAEGASTRRADVQRQMVQTAHRAYESDYGASTGSDNSGKSHFDSAALVSRPVRTLSSPRTPCLKPQSHDSDQSKPSTSRQGRQDETRGRTLGGAVGSRFEPQAFSSPHRTTFDQRFLDAEYDSEGDRNLSSNTPPSVHPYEIPEKEPKKESWEPGKSSYEYSTPINSQYGGGSSEYLSGRGEHAQSRTEPDAVSEQKSPTVVSDGDGAGSAYLPPSVTPRSRQGPKSLVPAVYTPRIRSHGGSQQPSLYEVDAESRAGSDAASVGSSSHGSLAHQSLVLKDHKLGVVKSAWTASSTSLHVASQSSSQLLPAALASSGKNLLGEIAFQLERRILDYVFCNNLPPAEPDDSALARKRRFYGYTVNNIGEMINREALAGDYYSKGTERMLRERLRTLLDILTPLGYDLADHARFSQDIINKYGLLPHPPVGQPGDMDTEVGICGVETQDLQHAIVFMSESETERSNLLLILDCLRMLAIEDGRPLFVWLKTRRTINQTN